MHAQTLPLLVLIVCLLTASGTVARAQESVGGESPLDGQDKGDGRSYLQDESDVTTLSGDFGGLGERLNDIGINSTLNL